MRGRMKDRLQAGGVTLLGLCLASFGCQSHGPLLDLNDGSRARVTTYPSSPVTAAQPGTPIQETATVERSGPRSFFPRLLRPRAVKETPTSAEIQAAPARVAAPGTVIASTSSWSPVQREGQPVQGALTPAAWQKDRPMPLPAGVAAPQLDPPGKQKPEKITPPPTLDPPTRAKPESEPALLHAPRPAPVEAVPEAVEIGLPHAPAFGLKAPIETGKVSLPPYVIEPPDILLVETLAGAGVQEIKGQHLVRPDGTIGLGIFGPVYVSGMTTEQAREAVAQAINSRLDPEELRAKKVKRVEAKDINVDVIAYNSKVYYVITDGGGFGEQVRRFPITGSETVLDAISHIDGLPAVASKKRIWVARRTHGDHGAPQIFPVNWIGITQGAQVATNYQVMPGDRIYVHSQKLIRADSMIGKFLAPFERMLGVTLLGSSTVNSIRGRGPGFGGVGVR